MLATAIVAVTAVGVSTAQVASTLSIGARDHEILNLSADSYSELDVTLVTVPKSEKQLLILENINDKALTINHVISGVFSGVISFRKGHSESITLNPSDKVSVAINGPSSPNFKFNNRSVLMKGRLIGGHLVLASH